MSTMNHLKWMGHSNTILDIQKSLRNDAETCEVTLVAKEHSVRAHRFVLSSCSDFLRNILQDIPAGQEATIMVPDIKGFLLDTVLAFIYLGEARLSSSTLSEFLEAISVLGIKSAISFECNALTTSTSSSSNNLSYKNIAGLQIAQAEIVPTEALEQKLESPDEQEQQTSSGGVSSGAVASGARPLEFLEVYNEAQHKITYSIEQMPGANNDNEYILTENSGTYTLTSNSKMDNASSSVNSKIEVVEEEEEEEVEDDTTDDTPHIIEEFNNSNDPIIEIAESGSPTSTNVPSTSAGPSTSHQVLQMKPRKVVKLKTPITTTSTTVNTEAANSTNNQNTNYKITTANEAYITLTDSQLGEGALELAVQAVINEGISLQKAALKYDISKTVLWRRVRKHPNYMKTSRENPVLTLAFERLKNGDSLKVISRDLDIPMSTLHRHKVRLIQQGALPKYVTFKKRKTISKDELEEKLSHAVHACVHEGVSLNHAANLYGIPKSTLWRHLQKRINEADMDSNMETEHIKEEVILS